MLEGMKDRYPMMRRTEENVVTSLLGLCIDTMCLYKLPV